MKMYTLIAIHMVPWRSPNMAIILHPVSRLQPQQHCCKTGGICGLVLGVFASENEYVLINGLSTLPTIRLWSRFRINNSGAACDRMCAQSREGLFSQVYSYILLPPALTHLCASACNIAGGKRKFHHHSCNHMRMLCVEVPVWKSARLGSANLVSNP